MKLSSTLVFSFALISCMATALAQPPDGRGGRGPGGPGGPRGPRGIDGSANGASPVERLMAMDVNGDGQLTADEITDARLRPILHRADANQNGSVSREELMAMIAQQPDGEGVRGQRGGGDRGFGGARFGAGGPPPGSLRDGAMRGGPGQFGPPPVGQILPQPVQDELGLSAEQRDAIAKLQAEVDVQLARILTEDQQRRLRQGPGGPRGPQGRGRDQGRPQLER